MSFTALLPIFSTIIDRIIPDKAARERARAELAVLEQQGELELLGKQLIVNANEAKHSSVFVAGWRPFIGWTCGAAFAYHYLVQPLFIFVAAVAGRAIDTPVFDMDSLLAVLLGMLGLGGLRTIEKYKNIARKKIGE